MPTLHIEFDETGGTLFDIRYKPLSGNVWSDMQAQGSPVDITIPNIEPYEYCIKKICNPGNESVEICGTANYQPLCAIPTFTFDNRNGNSFQFLYSLGIDQQQFDIEVTPPYSTSPTITRYIASTNTSPLTIIIQNLISGTYRFRMRAVCGVDTNSPVSNWTSYVDEDVIVATCQAPSMIMIGDSGQGSPGEFTDISWSDTNTIENRAGDNSTVTIDWDGDTNFDIQENTLVLEVYDSSDLLIDTLPVSIGDNEITSYPLGAIRFRLKALDVNDVEVYSNVLQYTYEGTVVLFSRSSGLNQSTNICGATLNNHCKVRCQNSTGTPVEIGDIVLNSNNSIFNGLNKWYKLLRELSDIGEYGFGCRVDSNGIIQEIIECEEPIDPGI